MLNDPRTRLGEVEPLHQMRVGTRRLRSDLRTFRPLARPKVGGSAARGADAGSANALGEVRDLDVMLDRLRADAGDLSPELPILFEAARSTNATQARARLLRGAPQRALRRACSTGWWRRRESRCAHDRRPRRPSRTLCRRWCAGRGKELRKKAAGAEREEPRRGLSTDVRVLTKRARYAAEAVAPALGRKRGRRAERFAERAAKLQDVLGSCRTPSWLASGFSRSHVSIRARADSISPRVS